jgi:hypothetical protein
MKKSWARSIGRWNLPRSDCDQVGAKAIVSKGERREAISVNYLLLPPLTTAGPVIIRCFLLHQKISVYKRGSDNGRTAAIAALVIAKGTPDRPRLGQPPGKWCAIAIVDRYLRDSIFRQRFSRIKEDWIEYYLFLNELFG